MSLRQAYARAADGMKADSLRRLTRGVDVNGTKLAAKKFPDRKPLGKSTERPGLFGLIPEAEVRARADGADVQFAEVVERFHRGGQRQPARKAVGWSRPGRRKAARIVLREIVSQIERARLGRGGVQ